MTLSAACRPSAAMARHYSEEHRVRDRVCAIRAPTDVTKKRNEPSERIKAKVMLDAARGLHFPHENGFLVFSLDEVLTVNGKLTDFGSSRIIHLLMTRRRS